MVTFRPPSRRRTAFISLGIAALLPALPARGTPATGGTAPSNSPVVSPDAPAQPPPAYQPSVYPPPVIYNPAPPIAAPYAPGWAPLRLPYQDGQGAPPGYHVEDKIRLGPTIAGAVLLAVPYALGLEFASLGHFSEQSGWLGVPLVGPWLMLALHKRPSCSSSGDQSDDGLCLGNDLDPELRFLVAVDGLLQAAGTAVLIFGINGRKMLIRDDLALVVMPAVVGGSGYGPAVSGWF